VLTLLYFAHKTAQVVLLKQGSWVLIVFAILIIFLALEFFHYTAMLEQVTLWLKNEWKSNKSVTREKSSMNFLKAL
jgi:hypothetical protein